MLTTTIRLDPHLMAKVVFHARRLGIARAAFMRDAVLAYVTHIEAGEELLREQFADVVADHDVRLNRIETFFRRGGRS